MAYTSHKVRCKTLNLMEPVQTCNCAKVRRFVGARKRLCAKVRPELCTPFAENGA